MFYQNLAIFAVALLSIKLIGVGANAIDVDCKEDGVVVHRNGDDYMKDCLHCQCRLAEETCQDENWRMCPAMLLAQGCREVPNPNRLDGTNENCCNVAECEESDNGDVDCKEDGVVVHRNGDDYMKDCLHCQCRLAEETCQDEIWRMCPAMLLAQGCREVPNPNRFDGTNENCCNVAECE